MSVAINISAYSNSENKEFQKHRKSVEFCIENELSFPKETSEFFKGKIDGDDLESYKREYLIPYLKDGIKIPLKVSHFDELRRKVIRVSEIPSSVETIVIELK